MKLWLLKNIAKFFSNQGIIRSLKRIDDNLFKLEFTKYIFYLDMTKGMSNIFINHDLLLPMKKYNAPFDVMLSKIVTYSRILDSCVDGQNRILRLFCQHSGSYKNIQFCIQFEFTGRHTNVILLDDKNVVLEALRHINRDRSIREVRINKILEPLAQPVLHLKDDFVELSIEALLEELKTNHTQSHILEGKKQTLIVKISKKIEKLQKMLDGLPKEHDLQKQADELAKNATIVLANLNFIENFVKEVRLKDFFDNEVKIILPEDCRTPQEGSNIMFSQSKKLIKKAKNIHLQIQNFESKINFLLQEINYIKTVKNLQDLLILEPKKMNKKSASKYEVIFIEGIKISIGRNKSENQALLEEAKADDIWLHIRDIPSSHMIIHCGKSKVYDEVLYKAGQILVGLNSIQIGNFSVDYTRRKFVKIIEGSNVIYSKYQTFHYKKPF
ncbi:NFACT family protein [Helicobacter sp. 13S00477-4]|uniref:NFACT family protein n=1 Tax=Helicobacter sp. 13S00477-4 TaxID=1905759 RepID=UPI000BA558D0|nr:NFACT family protein [Helicobacter sp. 13S00477-4]PAF52152.1 hypothetical protein BKH44_03355 [Helicobacter sp. 13S00477-4]